MPGHNEPAETELDESEQGRDECPAQEQGQDARESVTHVEVVNPKAAEEQGEDSKDRCALLVVLVIRDDDDPLSGL